MSSLDLALIGNGMVGALVNAEAEIVWACFPRFDGDPAFCSLLRGRSGEQEFGYFAVDLIDAAKHEQQYLHNTPVLVTRVYDHHGGCIELTDFAPRFRQHGRVFSPMSLVRCIRRLAGSPRVRIRLRPARDYGRSAADITFGSNHIRYLGADCVMRLTTDASVTALLEGNPFFLEDSVTLLFGPDETVQASVAEVGRRFLDETVAYWRRWVRYLSVPFEWQDAVIRAAITLKLNAYEDTGAIIAAMTTSVPEAPGSGRNWDYRYCWLRDGYMVVNALNRLGQTRTMERYLAYIVNVAAGADHGRLQPVYGISGRSAIEEQEIECLGGYRGMGPVRIGNQAYRQEQHDVYGSAVLAARHVFFDRRLARQGDEVLFRRLEPLGARSIEIYDQPDAGLWELRGTRRVHTFSAVMCWAACDRLAKIAAHLHLNDRAHYWSLQAQRIHETVCARAWNPRLNSFTTALEGNTVDASLLLLNELGFLAAEDPRFSGTVRRIERELRRGDFVFRYTEEDDFGVPKNAFLACTFWFINALSALERRDEARTMFENVLACRNRHGLLAEHIDPDTREQWGNFVQTYSMVGLLSSAIRLSVRWDQAF